MNICIVSNGFPPDNMGGISVYVYHLATGLAKLGHNVFIIAQSADDKESQETVQGVYVHRCRRRHLPLFEQWFPGLMWSWDVSQRIVALDREHGLTVVEFQNWEGAGFWYLLKRRRRPVLMRLITPYFETMVLDKARDALQFADHFICWLEKHSCAMADRLVAPTRHHAEFMSKAYELDAGSIDVSYLGIQVPKLASDYLSVKVRNAIGPVRVLYVSRLESRKGTITLFDAIPKVLSVFPDAEFVFIGRDRNHAPGGLLFKDYFASRYPDCQGKVRFLGMVTDAELDSFYRSSDIFVVPSLYESFGLIYVEAMAYGLPVIGGSSGGMQEVIDDEVTGYQMKSIDGDSLAACIVRLARNRELRKAMGAAGMKRVREMFDQGNAAKNTILLYQSLVTKKKWTI